MEICKRVYPVLYSFCISSGFSTDVYFNSGSRRVLKKNTTGLPFWFKPATKAMSEASVSNLNSWDSSTTPTTHFSVSNPNDSNAFLAFSVIGNYFDFRSRSILSENLGIHQA